jgi:hypothetical protein
MKRPQNSRRSLPKLSRRGNRVPVAAAVFTAVAALALWQLRLAADEAPGKPAAADASIDESPRDASAEPGDAKGRRLREGTQLTDCLGHFRQTGDVVAFIDENGRDIGGLPNLNLERITRMLKAVDEPENIWWSVSGTITEFSGRNYVLITRAVYKASTPPPSPESLATEAEPQP